MVRSKISPIHGWVLVSREETPRSSHVTRPEPLARTIQVLPRHCCRDGRSVGWRVAETGGRRMTPTNQPPESGVK